MITVEFNRDRLFLGVSGHAGYEKRGRDIVCAGVSTLVFALGKYLGKIEKHNDSVFVFSENPGNPKHAAAFDMVLEGLYMMEKSFGEYIKIINQHY